MQQVELELIDDIFSFTHNPLGFVKYAFPWTVDSSLQDRQIEGWQEEILTEIGDKLKAGTIDTQQAIQIAVASGHGIGKSALVSWLILWAMSTCVDTKGVVTANTENQLKTKTWAELAKWYRLCICKHWFKYTATALFSSNADHEKTWRIDMVPWSERNPEAFAGLHNKGKRIIFIFDEASAILDLIWEVSEGALTDEDTEIIWCAFGNPTRNTGRFKECFGQYAHRWITKQIDSRSVSITNKTQIQKWIDDHGEDSDFVRVRVRGLFPSSSDMQLIPTDWVENAQKREEFYTLDDPLILGLDIARGGEDDNVIWARRGKDARSIPPLIIPGSETRDSMRLVGRVVTHVQQLNPDAVFVDSTGVGGPVADRLRQLGVNAIDVNFASKAMNSSDYANMRGEMWCKMKEDLKTSLAIPDDKYLYRELIAPEYHYDISNRILLEKKDDIKKRLKYSPDRADALALTYAMPVIKRTVHNVSHSYTDNYNPLADL